MADELDPQLLREVIQSRLADLKRMDYRALHAWAKAQGYDDGLRFKAFKSELKRFGVDYEALRAKLQAGIGGDLRAQVRHSVTLYSDAKAKKNRFGICCRWERPVFYGKFFASDTDYNGEQSSGEKAAAKKAVWLAFKIREAIGAPAIVLNLWVDAKWMVSANKVLTGEKGGKSARSIADYANSLGVVLNMRWIAGTENPADQWTVARGFMRWNERPLKSLLDPEFTDWLNR